VPKQTSAPLAFVVMTATRRDAERVCFAGRCCCPVSSRRRACPGSAASSRPGGGLTQPPENATRRCCGEVFRR
jgi:hypothetical protein